MLSRTDWNKIKKKLAELPPERRLKELKVLLVQTADKSIIKEIKDLTEKAVLEIQNMAPTRESSGGLSIGKRLRKITDESSRRSGELEDLVANVPVPKTQKENDEVTYQTESGPKGAGYFSEGYDSSFEKVSEETRSAKTVEDVRESFLPENRKYTSQNKDKQA